MDETTIEELTTEELELASGGFEDTPDWVRNVGDLRRWMHNQPL